MDIQSTPSAFKQEASSNGAPNSYQPDEDSEILLALMRCANIRLKLMQTELDEVGVSLRYGVISPDAAIAWLKEIDAAQFCLLPPALEATAREVPA